MTRGVPSMATRFSATTRPILFCSGDTQRLNSSSRTWFGLIVTTIWGRSTEAGIAIDATATDRSDDGAAGPGTALSVKNCDEGVAAQPVTTSARVPRITTRARRRIICPGAASRDGARDSPSGRAGPARRA